MHENARLLEKFYESVQAHDHRATAACYHAGAASRTSHSNCTTRR